ncbi:MAG: hypothetical protein COC19_03365 [SAR86 cluster bacterium]|uniref:LamG-like jellyroll fold domain-containing protein n=1 Tax=SAR86 cluster bacterium TaxID=2030880 RepID=A0A2A4MQT9_9GAMM|nr:MAG: hypothetical protein COC19_03365 [SAR86 cluster bacterium]
MHKIYTLLCLTPLVLTLQIAHADTVKVLEWNISGNELSGNSTNQAEAGTIFTSEDADIIALQETSRGAADIANLLSDNYDQIAAVDGQEIWLRKGERFVVDSSGEWAGSCNGMSLRGASATISDLNSNSKLYLYSAHFCVPDTFGGSVDTLPDISNEDQQEHLCNIITDMEANASLGTVIVAADFNNINIPEGESLISFLQGTGTLNAGFCNASAISLIDIANIDVTHILGNGDASRYSDAATSRPNFGQHGYAVTSVELSDTQTPSEPPTTVGSDGRDSSATITGSFVIEGSDDTVSSVSDTDHVTITGNIIPEQDHVNRSGDLYVVLSYEGQLFYKDSVGGFIAWDGEAASLAVYAENINLDSNIIIDVISGQLLGLNGTLAIHYAYSVDGIIYYNITPASLQISASVTQASNDRSSALIFDGIDDRVTIPYNDNFPTEVFTASAWINLSAPARRAAIIARGEDDNSFNLSWQLYVSSAGNLEVMLEDSREVNYCYPLNDCVSQGSCTLADQMVADSSWHHVAVSRDSANTLRFYIDGQARSFCEGTGIPSSNNFQDMSIGATFGTIGPPPDGVEPPTWFFQGSIDDAAVFNTALSAEQILSLYNNGVDINQGDLVATWSFDTDTSQNIPDLSAMENHGYLGASPEVDSADPIRSNL